MKLVGGEVVRRWKRTLIYAIREVYESTRVDEGCKRETRWVTGAFASLRF